MLIVLCTLKVYKFMTRIFPNVSSSQDLSLSLRVSVKMAKYKKHRAECKSFGDSSRIIFMIAFGFLPQNGGIWQRSINDTLSFYKCRLSGGYTQTLPTAIKFV